MKKRNAKSANIEKYSIFKTILFIVSICFSVSLLIISFFDNENGIPLRVISIITLFFGGLSFILFRKRIYVLFVNTALKYMHIFFLVVETLFAIEILAVKHVVVRNAVLIVAAILFAMWGLSNILFPERIYYKDFFGKTHWK